MVTIDVVGLYPHITIDKVLQTIREALREAIRKALNRRNTGSTDGGGCGPG